MIHGPKASTGRARVGVPDDVGACAWMRLQSHEDPAQSPTGWSLHLLVSLPSSAGKPHLEAAKMAQQLMKTLSGAPVLVRGAPSRSGRSSLRVHAGPNSPNWKLEQPKRLWEIGSELW